MLVTLLRLDYGLPLRLLGQNLKSRRSTLNTRRRITLRILTNLKSWVCASILKRLAPESLRIIDMHNVAHVLHGQNCLQRGTTFPKIMCGNGYDARKKNYTGMWTACLHVVMTTVGRLSKQVMRI